MIVTLEYYPIIPIMCHILPQLMLPYTIIISMIEHSLPYGKKPSREKSFADSVRSDHFAEKTCVQHTQPSMKSVNVFSLESFLLYDISEFRSRGGKHKAAKFQDLANTNPPPLQIGFPYILYGISPLD